MTKSTIACVKGVLKGQTALSDTEIEKIIGDMRARARAAKVKAGGTQTQAQLSAIAARRAERLRIEAAIQKRNAMDNAIKRRVLLDQRANYVRGAAKNGNIADWAEAMANPSNRNAPGARDSATAKQQGYIGKYIGGMFHDFSQAGLMPYVAVRLRDLIDPRKWGKGPLDEKIEDELWELTIDGGKPGRTGSKEAAAIAKIVHKYQELARADQNRLGAFIGKIPGYIVAQTHDMARISRDGFNAWRSRAERTYGNDRTYENVQFTGDAAKDAKLVDEFWRKVYSELSQGEFFQDVPDSGFRGPGNLAKRVSQHRTLHPNSSALWREYNDRYGSSSFMEAVIGGLRRAGNAAGLMEKFGTNPRAQFEGMIAEARDFDLKAGLQIDKRIDKGGFTSRLFDVVDGTADIPARVSAAQIGAAARAWQSMSKLGAAVLSSLPDVALSAAVIRDDFGDNLLSAALGNIKNRLAQFTDGGQQREMALMLHVGLDSIIQDVAGRMTGADAVNWRWVHKAQNAFFRLNALSLFTDSGDRGLAKMINVRLAGLSQSAFAKLPAETRAAMEKHNIGAGEWDLIRKWSRHNYNDDPSMPMLLGDKLRDMPLQELDPIIKAPRGEKTTPQQMDRRRELARQELESKFHTFFIDRVRAGVIRGTAKEKTFGTHGLQAGTPAGEAMRFVMQFKQYPMSFVQQIIGRYAEEDRFWRIPGALARRMAADPGGTGVKVASLVTMLTLMGYAAGALKDIAKGREPRDPRDPRTWGAAFVQGGGAGLYGDYLFARTNRFGGSFLEGAIGPTIATAGEGADVLLGGRDAIVSDIFGDGETEYPDNKAFNWFKNNTPAINLFYTRAALDYLILYRIQEELSPGSLRRMENKLRTEQGQEFIFPPSEAVQ